MFDFEIEMNEYSWARTKWKKAGEMDLVSIIATRESSMFDAGTEMNKYSWKSKIASGKSMWISETFMRA